MERFIALPGVCIPLMLYLGSFLRYMDIDTIGSIFGYSIFPVDILYVIARVVTLILTLTSLRDLPPGAFNTVHWTTFIPLV